MVSRIWHAIVAALVVVAIVLQIHQALGVASLPPEQSTGQLRGTDATGRIIRVLSFFTIQSNILVGVAAALVALDPGRDGRGFRVLRLMSLVGITVTAIVYSAILAATHDPVGFEQTLINALVHYVIPAAAVLGWLTLGPRPRIDRRTVGLTLLWPAAWLAYTLVRGALWHWYPYPFVDVKARVRRGGDQRLRRAGRAAGRRRRVRVARPPGASRALTDRTGAGAGARWVRGGSTRTDERGEQWPRPSSTRSPGRTSTASST